MPVLFGARAGDGVTVLVFAVVFFISILVHELGHAFVMRYFGQPARIVLYAIGGLAIADSGNPWSSTRRRFTSNQQIMVSFAGPFAGFLLAIAFALIIVALQGKIAIITSGILPSFHVDFSESKAITSPYLASLLYFGMVISVFLNVLNLLPIYPLDGGQIARELFIQNDHRDGERKALMLSLLVAIGVGLFALLHGQHFIGIFFGFLAWNNYQMLNMSGGGGGYRRPW
ncbi:MAG TPA: M50 family metallopeptidase [Pirellulaceae bacterium]|nr:M50 family metallopeptidase [Pirellulaceae bacterium]